MVTRHVRGGRLLAAVTTLVLAVIAVEAAYGPPAEEWAQKSVLHILTDRYAIADCPANPRVCKDLDNACGGTHVGLRQRLDYIQGMGFDAVWISPVTSQTGGPIRELQDGWHGYWPKNLWDLNSGFGTPKDFADLTKAIHDRGMWVMLDIVPNHSGYFKEENISEMTFDEPACYHSCTECEKGTCNIPAEETPELVEVCRIKGLPDLNQSVPYVAETLHKWMAWIRDEYQIDGFRVDAAKHLPVTFMQEVKKRANILTMGEVLDMDWQNGTIRLANMLRTNQLHSQLSYGLYSAVQRVFFGSDRKNVYLPADTKLLSDAVNTVMETMPGYVNLLGNFLDNHDMARIAAHDHTDIDMAMNSLVFNFFIPGIPIVYYGTEAGMEGQREPLWEKWNWDTKAPLYVKIKMLNWYRHHLRLWEHTFQTVYVDGLVYTFARGDVALVVLSGQTARQHPEELPRVVGLTDLPEGMRGKSLYNVFNPNVTLTVNVNGTADLKLLDLQPLLFVQEAKSPASFLPPQPRKWLLPVNQIVLIITLITMSLVYVLLQWNLVAPPEFVLRCCGRLHIHFTKQAHSNQKQQQQLQGNSKNHNAANKDHPAAPKGWDRIKQQKVPALDNKVMQHVQCTIPETNKVDTTVDLHKAAQLRCLAELDSDEDSTDYIPAVRHKSPDKRTSSPGTRSVDSLSTHSVQPLDENSIMHVAMEYTIPELGMDGFVFGGLGKVVDCFAKEWPGDMVLCAPLYAAAYSDATATAPKFISGPPVLRFDVAVGRQNHQVEVFEFTPGLAPGKSRRYLLLQASVFRHRSRSDIYSFASEHDMITWLSVVNQAVAMVVMNWGVRRLQLHDYHGALSLQYLPKQLRPQVLYIAHNAHYNGVFALPTKQRRAYLYSMFNLNPAAVGKYTEHKSAFDTLHSLLSHMVEAQKGVGCAAVSPNYAAEIRTRLSPFWQIPQGEVIGILNAMDPIGTWAGDAINVDEAIARKTAAKLKVQERMGLTVGEQYQLAVFLGRLTHQKGVDIIAQAAPQVLARYPKLQLLVVGPLGDVAGAEAQDSLGALAIDCPGRLVAPANHYVSGDEKELVLAAADFCLCPSRYEPCGLVDIEFGWYGGLIIGNETGGLGKMPGFYFSAAAATVPHLAAKLASAFSAALTEPPEKKRQLIAAALARRFPTEHQMQAYQLLWKKIGDASRAAAGRHQVQATSDTDSYFAQSWQRRNLNLQAALVASTASPPASICSSAGTSSRVSISDGGNSSTASVSPNKNEGSTKRLKVPGLHNISAAKRYQQDEEISPKHAFSNYLVVLLQSMGMLPSLLLLGYMLLQQISRQTWSTCPLRPHDNEWLPGLNGIGMRVMWQLILSTAAAPMWTSLAFRKSPRSYITMVCIVTVVCLMVVVLSFIWQQTMNAALLLVSPAALAGFPLLSLCFMGCHQELSEVGYHLMLVSDSFKSLLLASCAALTFFSFSHMPFLITAAAAAVVMTAVATWMCLPDSLAPGYIHLKLNMNWREQRVVLCSGPKSPHLSLCVSVLDMAGLSLLGYLLCSTKGLSTMIAINSAGFAASIIGTALAVALLQSRGMQLHLQSATLLLAALPGAAVAKAVAAWQLGPLWQVLTVAAGTQVIMGARGPLNGLLAMMTLPSREAVAVWQLMGVMLSNLAILATVILSGVVHVEPESLVVPLLIALGAVEGLRLVCGAILGRIHPKENLCAL